MYLAEIWRYPVKSMGGERLARARLGADGIAGDRVLVVRSPAGGVLTARRYPRLLGHRATLDPAGAPLIDGRPWSSAEVARDVAAVTVPGAELAPPVGLRRFDVLPLLVATDGAVAAFGRDGRRLRPNLVIGGVAGLAEREWESCRLLVGDCVVGAVALRDRCVMTTYDPDTQEQDPAVLRLIVERFGGKLALNAEVLRGGTIQVGDRVTVELGLAPSV